MEEGATVGAVLGVNLFNADGSLVTVAQFSTATVVQQTINSSGGASAIAGLSDVDLTGLADNDMLRYDLASGKWKPEAVPAGGAGIVRVVQLKVANFAAGAAAATDYVYVCTGTLTGTLPTAAGNTNRYTYKNAGVGVLSAASTGGQTFDGTASPIALNPGQSLDFISDGTNWTIN